MKIVKNIEITHPTTGKRLGQEMDVDGTVDKYWTVGSAMLFVLENQPAQTVGDIVKMTDTITRLKPELEKEEITLSKGDFDLIKSSSEKYNGFLQKGITFANYYKALEDVKDAE